MPPTNIHDDEEGRYGEFRLEAGDLVVYDRENSSAWIRIESPAAVET